MLFFTVKVCLLFTSVSRFILSLFDCKVTTANTQNLKSVFPTINILLLFIEDKTNLMLNFQEDNVSSETFFLTHNLDKLLTTWL